MPVPGQVIIKISRFRLLLDAGACLLVPFGIISLLQWGGWAKLIMAIVAIAIGLVTIIGNFHEMLRFNRPQLILNNVGLQTSDGNIYAWTDISHEKIVEQGSGRYRNYFLQFRTPHASRQIDVSWLTESPSKILSLIKLFKQEHA